MFITLGNKSMEKDKNHREDPRIIEKLFRRELFLRYSKKNHREKKKYLDDFFRVSQEKFSTSLIETLSKSSRSLRYDRRDVLKAHGFRSRNSNASCNSNAQITLQNSIVCCQTITAKMRISAESSQRPKKKTTHH